MTVQLKALFLIVGTLLFSSSIETALADECPLVHALPGSGKPFYAPDTRAGYAAIGYLRPERPIRLELKGSFPKARQVNVTVYNDEAIQTDWILDSDIEPDPGSINPFREGVSVNAAERNFTVKFSPNGQGTNHLALPNTSIVSIWFRYYDLRNDDDILAADFVPKLFVYDLETGAPAPCPTLADPNAGQDIGQDTYTAYLSTIRLSKTLDFFKYGGDTFFSNPHNQYVFALPLNGSRAVTVVKFKAPSFFDDRKPGAVFRSDTNVRYWSYCITDLSTGYQCLIDRQMIKDRDGNVTIVIGDQEALAYAQSIPGVNVLAKPADSGIMMNYIRQLVANPGFVGDFTNVNPGDLVTPNEVGLYAPNGTRCEMLGLRLNLCGFGKPRM